MRFFALRKRLLELEERVAELEAGAQAGNAWYPMPPRHEIEIAALPELPDFRTGYVEYDEEEEYRGTGLYL